MKMRLVVHGNLTKTKRSLWKKAHIDRDVDFEKYAKLGLDALKAYTPTDTGYTHDSWYYKVEKNQNGVKITWYNKNVVDGANVAVLVQYGHASKDGDWVEGVDYINPALRPVFNDLVKNIKEELRNVKGN